MNNSTSHHTEKKKNFFSDFLSSFLQHLFVARVKEDKSHGRIQKMFEKGICFQIEVLNWLLLHDYQRLSFTLANLK
jgi:hypothetical protein